MKQYNAIVIGLGKIGMLYGFDKKRTQPASHISAILANNKINLLAVSDVDENARKQFAKSYSSKVDVFSDYTELINKIKKEENTDIIVVATRDDQHYPMLRKIIKILNSYKKPLIIFCEKPITRNTSDAKKIKKILTNKNISVVVNHSRRWSKIWNKVHKLSKHIGMVQKAEFIFSTSPENIQLDQMRDGIHIADVISWFGIENHTRISRLKIPYFVYEFYLWGEKGKIEVVDVGEKINYYLAKKSKKFQGFNELSLIKSFVMRESMLENAYLEFVKFLDGRGKLSTNLEDAIMATATFEKYVYDKDLSKTMRKKNDTKI